MRVMQHYSWTQGSERNQVAGREMSKLEGSLLHRSVSVQLEQNPCPGTTSTAAFTSSGFPAPPPLFVLHVSRDCSFTHLNSSLCRMIREELHSLNEVSILQLPSLRCITLTPGRLRTTKEEATHWRATSTTRNGRIRNLFFPGECLSRTLTCSVHAKLTASLWRTAALLSK